MGGEGKEREGKRDWAKEMREGGKDGYEQEQKKCCIKEVREPKKGEGVWKKCFKGGHGETGFKEI